MKYVGRGCLYRRLREECTWPKGSPNCGMSMLMSKLAHSLFFSLHMYKTHAHVLSLPLFYLPLSLSIYLAHTMTQGNLRPDSLQTLMPTAPANSSMSSISTGSST